MEYIPTNRTAQIGVDVSMFDLIRLDWIKPCRWPVRWDDTVGTAVSYLMFIADVADAAGAVAITTM